MLPTALDIAAWLGSADARTILHDSGDDAYAGFDVALELSYQRRPSEEQRHTSLHMSALDAIATYLSGSRADTSQPAALGSAWRRRKLDVALGAWATLRHDGDAFTRLPSAKVTKGGGVPAPHSASAPRSPGFVEAHPEAIGKLVSFVRQARDGLAVGGIANDSQAGIVLLEVDAMLSLCLRVALQEANDEAIGQEDAVAMVAMPARLAALDARLMGSRSADVTLAADVHLDVGSSRVLEEATGYLDDMYLLVREPVTGRMILAVGASIAHYELAQPASLRLSDGAWRARLGTSPPPRNSFTSVYLVIPE